MAKILLPGLPYSERASFGGNLRPLAINASEKSCFSIISPPNAHGAILEIMIVGKRYIAMISNPAPKISALVVKWSGKIFIISTPESLGKLPALLWHFVDFILLSDEL